MYYVTNARFELLVHDLGFERADRGLCFDILEKAEQGVDEEHRGDHGEVSPLLRSTGYEH